MGVLPLAPLATFASAVRLRWLFRRRHEHENSCWRPAFRPPRLGLQWATSSVPVERARGMALLRSLGDEDLLRRLCYGDAGRPVGLLSAFALYGSRSWVPRPQLQ